jgi:hypothetical protein
MMTLRTVQTCCWIVFLGYVLFGGVATQYVIAWQVWLILGSLVVLVIGLFFRQWDTHEHEHEGEGHDHQPVSWSETGVHILPLMLLVSVGATTLGTHALGNGSNSAFVPPPPSPNGVMLVDAQGYRQTDLLALRHDPFLAGGKISLTVRLGELAEQTTRRRRSGPAPSAKPVLFRHIISCCAADGPPRPPVGGALHPARSSRQPTSREADTPWQALV